MWLLNKDEEITQKLTLLSAVHTEVINAENAITFSCLEQVEKKERVLYKDERNKYHEFIIQEVIENKGSNEVYAEHSAYEMHGDFVEEKRPTGTALVHLESIISNTRWSIGHIDGTEILSKTYYRQSVYESINDLCTLFNTYRTYEIIVVGNKITERLIHIRNEIGVDEGKRFVYSKDLLDVERTILMNEVITALYGFGRGEEIGDGFGRRINFGDLDMPDSPKGKMYISDERARIEWGRNNDSGKVHVYGKVEFDDVEDIEELYLKTKQKLQELNTPKVNYQAKVILLEEELENIEVGDTVAIIDKDFRGRELRLKGKVFKIERDLINVSNSVVELGNYIDDLSDANTKLNNFVNDFRDKTGVWDKSNAFDAEGKLNSSFIKDIIEGWNDQMNGSSGFVYGNKGEGLITYDRAVDDNPTMAIQIVGGGWRIANSKKSNGEWDWRTLGTGDGIYGDQIIANTITVNQLKSDVGTNLDLSSNQSISLVVKQEIENEIDDIDRRLTENENNIDNATTSIKENSVNITLNSQSIQNEVSAREEMGANLLSETKSLIEQTVDSYELEFSRIETAINDNQVSLDELRTYYRYTAEEAIVGKDGDPMQFYFANDEAGFRENGERIAYWQGRQFYVENLHVLSRIIVGQHVIESEGDLTKIRSVK